MQPPAATALAAQLRVGRAVRRAGWQVARAAVPRAWLQKRTERRHPLLCGPPRMMGKVGVGGGGVGATATEAGG